jgi:hypothetical protein
VDLLVHCLVETRPFRKERASDDAKRQARITALQEPDGGLHGVHIPFGVRQKIPDGRRHANALAEFPGPRAQLLRHAGGQRRRVQTQEQQDGRVGLRNLHSQAGGMLAQKSRQIGSGWIRRIQLDHRRGNEQDAHGACSITR